VSVYFVPYLGALFLKVKPHVVGEQPHELYNTPAFRKTVNWCVAHRWITIGAMLLLFAMSIVGMGKVQQQFFPDSSRPEILLDVWHPEGTSFEANEKITKRLEARLMADPGV
jgi:multidrug efflux pump